MARRSHTIPIGVFAGACVITAGMVVFAHRTHERVSFTTADDAHETDAHETNDDAADDEATGANASKELEFAQAEEEQDTAPVHKRAAHKQASSTVASSAPLVPLTDPDATVRGLFAPAADERAPAPTELVARIVALGPQVLPQLVGIVCGDFALPDVVPGTQQASIDDDVLGQREQIARDAIAQFAPAQQLASIVAHATQADLHRRLILIQLLGTVEHDDALRAVLDLTRPIEAIDLQRSYVRGPIEAALSAQIVERRDVSRELKATLGDRDPALLALLGRACVEVGSIASAELVGALFGRSRELDLELFDALGKLDSQARFAVPDDGLDYLRRQLSGADEELRRSAVMALGALRDDASLEALIDLLSLDDARIADAAHWSLRTITLVDRGADARQWDEWLDEQKKWHEERAPELALKLESERFDEVVDALTELLERPSFRAEAVEAIAPLLAREDPEIFRAAVSALETIGSRRAVAALQDAMPGAIAQRRGYIAAALKRVSNPKATADGVPTDDG